MSNTCTSTRLIHSSLSRSTDVSMTVLAPDADTPRVLKVDPA